MMRTTISLEEDVIHRARFISEKMNTSFRYVLNEALRKGLDSIEPQLKPKPFKTHSRKMGLRSGKNLNNIGELLTEMDVEAHS